MSHALFSYGTLRDPGVQRAIFGREVAMEGDALVGFRRDWIDMPDDEVVRISGETRHPILRETRDPVDVIEGAVLLLDEAALAAADDYEGERYRRIEVRLRSGRAAFVYVGV